MLDSQATFNSEATMPVQAGNAFSHVKPGDTAFREEGLRDFFDSLRYSRLS